MTPAELTRDIDFYYEAVKLTKASEYTTKVGCLSAKGNKRLALAVNTVRNPAKNVPYGEATTHAEMNVLHMLNSTARVTLYIARVGKLMQELPSRPCHRCMLEIRNSGIKEIVYLDKFHKVVKEIL